MITFQKADKDIYLKFRQDLEQLYLKTFTQGISAQQISKNDAEIYLKSIFESGYGIFGFENQKLISALLVTPISYDDERPNGLIKNFIDDNTLYIAEVLVDESARGQGIGKKIMLSFEEQLEEKIQHVILRVWRENVPAVNLYKKIGFKNCGEITQEKIRPDTKEKFTMHKNYMIKSY